MNFSLLVLARDLSIIFSFILILTTGLRLHARISSCSRSSESFWRGARIISDIFVVLATLTYLSMGITYVVQVAVLSSAHTKIKLFVGINYADIVSTYVITWSTRISLAMLFLGKPYHRFDVRSRTRRWFPFASVMIVAVAASVVLATQTIKGCEEHPEWKHMPVVRCQPGKYIGIFHLALYTAFDIWSLGCTIRTLDLGRKNPDYKWRVLGASLGACLSSIVLSVSRAVFIVVGNLKGYLITDVIECGIAVIAANLPILVPIIYNARFKFRQGRETTRSPSPISFRRPTVLSEEATGRKDGTVNSAVSTLSVGIPPSPGSQIGSTSSLIPRSCSENDNSS